MDDLVGEAAIRDVLKAIEATLALDLPEECNKPLRRAHAAATAALGQFYLAQSRRKK